MARPGKRPRCVWRPRQPGLMRTTWCGRYRYHIKGYERFRVWLAEYASDAAGREDTCSSCLAAIAQNTAMLLDPEGHPF